MFAPTKITFITILLIDFKGIDFTNVKDYFEIYRENHNYCGEKFPIEYLSTDGVRPTHEDFSYYVNTLYRVIGYFASNLNRTDPNVALGAFVMKAILKRVLLDNDNKITKKEKGTIKDMINKAEDVVSHFTFPSKSYRPQSVFVIFSKLFLNDESLIVSLGKHNRYSLQKWITSNLELHEFKEKFDDLSLPKEVYAELVIDSIDESITDSETCLAWMSSLPLPLRNDDELKHCNAKNLKKIILKMPSVAYTLSHRLLFLVLSTLSWRCFMVSEAIDRMHMDIMCANMYRETVYLARRGYFYRDLFLEHITICGLLGYEEFYRTRWFKKSASWIDEDGCMGEFHNSVANRSRILVSRQTTTRAKKIMKRLRTRDFDECSLHQMSLVINVLAHGIRHAAHYMKCLVEKGL